MAELKEQQLSIVPKFFHFEGYILDSRTRYRRRNPFLLKWKSKHNNSFFIIIIGKLNFHLVGLKSMISSST